MEHIVTQCFFKHEMTILKEDVKKLIYLVNSNNFKGICQLSIILEITAK